MLEWGAYARRLSALRNQLMVHGRRRRLLKMAFRDWKRGVNYRIVIMCGFRHLYIHQVAQAWQRMLDWLPQAKLLHLLRTHFIAMRDFARSSQRFQWAWIRWAAHYQLHKAASIIQGGCRGHLLRCKMRRINKLARVVFASKHAFKLLKQRKRVEQKRLAKEEQVIQPIVPLAASLLVEYLRCAVPLRSVLLRRMKAARSRGLPWNRSDEGASKLEEFREAVKAERKRRRRRAYASRRENVAGAAPEATGISDGMDDAPRADELPLFHGRAFVFSVGRHTVDVLLQRCREAATHLARRQYRKSHPPLHECMRCDEVFSLRVLRDYHRRQQPREGHAHCCRSYKREYSSLSWHHAKDIVDIVMQRVAEAYYGKH
jgi:hypothetical protein